MSEDELIQLATLLRKFQQTQNVGMLEDAVTDVVGAVEDTLAEIAADR